MSAIYETSVNERVGKDPRTLDAYIEGTACGQKAAFEKLYRAASSPVFAYALSLLKNRQDAEDVLHDCFLNIYNSASGYQSAGKPMAWIMTIARNLCMSSLRARQRSSDIPEEDWEPFLQMNNDLPAEDRLTIQGCMELLGDEERTILLLHAVTGFKHREIAEFLDLPLATVLSKYARAAKKMKTILEKESIA